MAEIELLKRIAVSLISSRKMVAVAESCTGGLLSAALTTLPGSSAWFDRGFITYSNPAKHELLDISENILATYGAVSSETAKAMASGVLRHSQAKIALAITGIAGPEGGSVEKPVGTVWFGVATQSEVPQAVLQTFSGTREAVRQQSVSFALKLLHNYLREEKK